jgi:hypothetical protein
VGVASRAASVPEFVSGTCAQNTRGKSNEW